MARLPLTSGRLQSSVVLRASKLGNVNMGTAASNLIDSNSEKLNPLDLGGSLDPTTIMKVLALNLEMGPIVGQGVLSFKRDQTRVNKRIYSLGRAAFEPELIVPGPITTNLTIERVVLYENDFMEALGFATGNLFYQQYPFSVQEIMLTPDMESNSLESQRETSLARAIFYLNCWLENNPIEYDVDNMDQVVYQEMKITVGQVISTTSMPFNILNSALKLEDKAKGALSRQGKSTSKNVLGKPVGVSGPDTAAEKSSFVQKAAKLGPTPFGK